MKQWIACAVVVSLVMGSTAAWAQSGQGHYLAPKLGVIGALTTLVVSVYLLPRGEEYHILGDTFCVSDDLHDVDYGGCGRTSTEKKFALYAMGAGVGMMLIGFHRVAVHPTLSPKVKGVSATVTW